MIIKGNFNFTNMLIFKHKKIFNVDLNTPQNFAYLKRRKTFTKITKF